MPMFRASDHLNVGYYNSSILPVLFIKLLDRERHVHLSTCE